jgi:hypothetical protein
MIEEKIFIMRPRTAGTLGKKIGGRTITHSECEKLRSHVVHPIYYNTRRRQGSIKGRVSPALLKSTAVGGNIGVVNKGSEGSHELVGDEPSVSRFIRCKYWGLEITELEGDIEVESCTSPGGVLDINGENIFESAPRR